MWFQTKPFPVRGRGHTDPLSTFLKLGRSITGPNMRPMQRTKQERKQGMSPRDVTHNSGSNRCECKLDEEVILLQQKERTNRLSVEKKGGLCSDAKQANGSNSTSKHCGNRITEPHPACFFLRETERRKEQGEQYVNSRWLPIQLM